MNTQSHTLNIPRSTYIKASAIITGISLSPTSFANLQKARGVVESLQSELLSIIPIVAALFLLATGIAYAGRFIEKDTFIRWAVGIIIAGSATQITSMLFS